MTVTLPWWSIPLALAVAGCFVPLAFLRGESDSYGIRTTMRFFVALFCWFVAALVALWMKP